MANLNSRQKRRNAYWEKQNQEAQQATQAEKMPRMTLVSAIDALSAQHSDGNRTVQEKVNGYSTETLSGIQQAVIHAEEVLKNGTEKDPRIVANYQTLVSKKEILNTASQKRIKDVEKGKRQVRPEEQKYYDSLVANTPKKESLLTRVQNKAKGAWNSVKETAGDARDSFQQWNTERKEHNAERRAQKEAEKKRQQEEQAKWEAERMAQLREFLQEKKKQDEHQAAVLARAERIRNIKKEKAKKLRREKMKARKETVTKWFSDAKGKVAEKYGVTKEGVQDWWQERKAEKARRKDIKSRWKESRKEAKRIEKEKQKAEKARRKDIKKRWKESRKKARKIKRAARWKAIKKFLKKAALYAVVGAAIYATGGLAAVAVVGGLYGAKKISNKVKENRQQRKIERAEFMKSKPNSRDDAIALVQQYQKENSKNKEEKAFEAMSPEQVTETWKQLGGNDKRRRLNMYSTRLLDNDELANRDAFDDMAHASENMMKKVANGEIAVDGNNGKQIAAWLAINKENGMVGNYTDKDGKPSSIKERNAKIEEQLKALGIEIPKLNEDKVNQSEVNNEKPKQREEQRPKENNTQETEETKDNKNNTQTQQPQKSEAQQRVELESLGIKEETAKKIYEDMNALRQYKQEYPNDKEGIQGLTESVEKNIKGQGDRGTADYGYKLDEKQQAAVKALYPDLFQSKEGRQKEQTKTEENTGQEDKGNKKETPARAKVSEDVLVAGLSPEQKAKYNQAKSEYSAVAAHFGPKSKQAQAAAKVFEEKLFGTNKPETDKDGNTVNKNIGLDRDTARAFKETLGRTGAVPSFKGSKQGQKVIQKSSQQNKDMELAVQKKVTDKMKNTK